MQKTTLNKYQKEDYSSQQGFKANIKKYGRFLKNSLEKIIPRTKYHPNYKNLTLIYDLEELQKLILECIENKRVLRAAGAQHSAPQAIFNTVKNYPTKHIKLEGKFREIEILEKTGEYLIVRTGAGINLGVDPNDPNSTEQNSFNRIVDKLGYGLPITGGMSHQTIGGFLSTGSAGGSTIYGFADVVESIEFVDGNGKLHLAEKGTDLYSAVGVSMGLFGIITHVTLKLQKTYLVQGVEQTVRREDSILKDSKTLKKSFKQDEYSHLVWFPQKKVKHVLEFVGKQVSTENKIVEYHHPLKETYMNYAAAATLWLINWFNSEQLLKLVNPIHTQKFCDKWFKALPNDDQCMIESLIRVQFTEVWIDIDRTDEVIEVLEKLFGKKPDAGGNFGVEIYPAKKSPFWMSAAYNRNVIRIDPYWWEFNSNGNLEGFFDEYWRILMTIPTARLHWGKHFPKLGTQYSSDKYNKIEIGPQYVKDAYPKFKQWMQMRKQYDPKQIFVTDYWRGMLGIEQLIQ